MTLQQRVTALTQLDWFGRINIGYGLMGFLLLLQFSSGVGAWKSFLAGWLLAVLNFELLKRLGTMLMALYGDGGKLDPSFYVLAVGKFLFWGLVIMLFSTARWIEGIPFALGVTTLVVSGLGLGMKELIYAR